MYGLATCYVRTTRGESKDARGERVPSNTVVIERQAASIVEHKNNFVSRTNNYEDGASQIPRRNILYLEMRISSNADVRSGDRVEDLTFGTKYVVQDVHQSTGPLFMPDKVCMLKRVD